MRIANCQNIYNNLCWLATDLHCPVNSQNQQIVQDGPAYNQRYFFYIPTGGGVPQFLLQSSQESAILFSSLHTVSNIPQNPQDPHRHNPVQLATRQAFTVTHTANSPQLLLMLPPRLPRFLVMIIIFNLWTHVNPTPLFLDNVYPVRRPYIHFWLITQKDLQTEANKCHSFNPTNRQMRYSQLIKRCKPISNAWTWQLVPNWHC